MSRASPSRFTAGLAGGAVLLGANPAAAAACLPYEPAQVVLVGRLAPARDDGRGPTLVLQLSRPACTQAGSGAPSEAHVREVRLVFPRDTRMLEGWAGRRVAVSGSLFRAAAAHRDAEFRLLVTGLGRVR